MLRRGSRIFQLMNLEKGWRVLTAIGFLEEKDAGSLKGLKNPASNHSAAPYPYRDRSASLQKAYTCKGGLVGCAHQATTHHTQHCESRGSEDV